MPEKKIIWQQSLTVTPQDMARRPYLKLGVHSDFVTADFRFSLVDKTSNKELLEPILVSNGYSNLVELGSVEQFLQESDDYGRANTFTTYEYDIRLYYIAGQLKDQSGNVVTMCPKVQVDLRKVFRYCY